MSDYWTDDLELPALNDVSPAHRRSHSDPTEMLDLRDQVHLIRDDPFEAVGAKRQASPVPGLSPAFKRQSAGEWLDRGFLNEETTAPAEAPKRPAPAVDGIPVPMWTVEEDLLILKLVEQHGKRWSRIAQELTGRTDNGVRNRWNRMEKAQASKATGSGYRCRRCGQPKRGHICSALTSGGAPAAAREAKAAAFSKRPKSPPSPSDAAPLDTLYKEADFAYSSPALVPAPPPTRRRRWQPRLAPPAAAPRAPPAFGFDAYAAHAGVHDGHVLDTFLDELTSRSPPTTPSPSPPPSPPLTVPPPIRLNDDPNASGLFPPPPGEWSPPSPGSTGLFPPPPRRAQEPRDLHAQHHRGRRRRRHRRRRRRVGGAGVAPREPLRLPAAAPRRRRRLSGGGDGPVTSVSNMECG